MASGASFEQPGAPLPRRLLISPNGRAHLPTCAAIGVHSMANGWGEVFDVTAAIALLAAGTSFDSTREGRPKMPGPQVREACRRCLHGLVRAMAR